jgi:hypothetical protein
MADPPEADLDEQIVGYFNDQSILAANRAANEARLPGEPLIPVPETYDGRLFDWLTFMFLEHRPPDGPARAWPVILTLIARAPDRQGLRFIGAGALENLVWHAGVEFEDRIIAQAAEDPRFRTALSEVWPSETVTPNLVTCIEAARAWERQQR